MYNFETKGVIMLMRGLVGILICLLIVCPFSVIAQEKEADTEAADTEAVATEAQEPELPPAIQEFLEKEMEKLPPLERHFRMAQHYHAMGKLEEAIGELELALEEDPSHVPSNCELGVIYMGRDNYDMAIIQLKKTLELDPEYPKTHYALANAYARKPEPELELARKHLDEAIRLGYHAVPWFLDYMKKLETKGKVLPESPETKEETGTETK